MVRRRRAPGPGFFGVRYGYGAGGLTLDIGNDDHDGPGTPPASGAGHAGPLEDRWPEGEPDENPADSPIRPSRLLTHEGTKRVEMRADEVARHLVYIYEHDIRLGEFTDLAEVESSLRDEAKLRYMREAIPRGFQPDDDREAIIVAARAFAAEVVELAIPELTAALEGEWPKLREGAVEVSAADVTNWHDSCYKGSHDDEDRDARSGHVAGGRVHARELGRPRDAGGGRGGSPPRDRGDHRVGDRATQAGRRRYAAKSQNRADLIRVLETWGTVFVEHGGEHDTYRASNGAYLFIPRHRIVSPGVVRQLVKRAGHTVVDYEAALSPGKTTEDEASANDAPRPSLAPNTRWALLNLGLEDFFDLQDQYPDVTLVDEGELVAVDGGRLRISFAFFGLGPAGREQALEAGLAPPPRTAIAPKRDTIALLEEFAANGVDVFDAPALYSALVGEYQAILQLIRGTHAVAPFDPLESQQGLMDVPVEALDTMGRYDLATDVGRFSQTAEYLEELIDAVKNQTPATWASSLARYVRGRPKTNAIQQQLAKQRPSHENPLHAPGHLEPPIPEEYYREEEGVVPPPRSPVSDDPDLDYRFREDEELPAMVGQLAGLDEESDRRQYEGRVVLGRQAPADFLPREAGVVEEQVDDGGQDGHDILYSTRRADAGNNLEDLTEGIEDGPGSPFPDLVEAYDDPNAFEEQTNIHLGGAVARAALEHVMRRFLWTDEAVLGPGELAYAGPAAGAVVMLVNADESDVELRTAGGSSYLMAREDFERQLASNAIIPYGSATAGPPRDGKFGSVGVIVETRTVVAAPLTGLDARRVSRLIRDWQGQTHDIADTAYWSQRFATLEETLAKTRPKSPVQLYRSEPEEPEQYANRFTAWSPSRGAVGNFGWGKRRLVTAIIRPENIVVDIGQFPHLDRDQMHEVIVRPGRYQTVPVDSMTEPRPPRPDVPLTPDADVEELRRQLLDAFSKVYGIAEGKTEQAQQAIWAMSTQEVANQLELVLERRPRQARTVRPPQPTPGVYYHGTSSHLVPDILQHGLRAGSGAEFAPAVANDAQLASEPGVYLTTWFEQAVRYGMGLAKEEDPAVIEVQLDPAAVREDLMDDPRNMRWENLKGGPWGKPGNPMMRGQVPVTQFYLPGALPPSAIVAVHVPNLHGAMTDVPGLGYETIRGYEAARRVYWALKKFLEWGHEYPSRLFDINVADEIELARDELEELGIDLGDLDSLTDELRSTDTEHDDYDEDTETYVEQQQEADIQALVDDLHAKLFTPEGVGYAVLRDQWNLVRLTPEQYWAQQPRTGAVQEELRLRNPPTAYAFELKYTPGLLVGYKVDEALKAGVEAGAFDVTHDRATGVVAGTYTTRTPESGVEQSIRSALPIRLEYLRIKRTAAAAAEDADADEDEPPPGRSAANIPDVPPMMWARAREALIAYVETSARSYAGKESHKYSDAARHYEYLLQKNRKAWEALGRQEPAEVQTVDGVKAFSFVDAPDGRVHIMNGSAIWDMVAPSDVDATIQGMEEHYTDELMHAMERAREQEATADDIRASNQPGAGGWSQSTFKIPADLTGWKYTPRGPPPRELTIVFHEGRVPHGSGDARGNYDPGSATVNVGNMKDVLSADAELSNDRWPVNDDMMADRFNTLRHELVHWVQYELLRAPDSPPGGLPSKTYDEEHALGWGRQGPEYPHALRDIEFYPNLDGEVANFMASEGYGDVMTKAKKWVSTSWRFQMLKEGRPEHWRKMVTAFMRLVAKGRDESRRYDTYGLRSLRRDWFLRALTQAEQEMAAAQARPIKEGEGRSAYRIFRAPSFDIDYANFRIKERGANIIMDQPLTSRTRDGDWRVEIVHGRKHFFKGDMMREDALALFEAKVDEALTRINDELEYTIRPTRAETLEAMQREAALTVVSGYFEGQTFSGDDGVEYSVPELERLARTHGQRRQLPVRELLHNLTENEADEPIGSPEFAARAEEADLAYPILVVEYPDAMWIADGLHRLWKAQQAGLPTIDAWVLPSEALAQLRTAAFEVTANKAYRSLAKTIGMDPQASPFADIDPTGVKGYLNWAVAQARYVAYSGDYVPPDAGEAVQRGPLRGTVVGPAPEEQYGYVVQLDNNGAQAVWRREDIWRRAPTEASARRAADVFGAVAQNLKEYDDYRTRGMKLKPLSEIRDSTELGEVVGNADQQWQAEPREERAQYEVLLDEPERKVIRFDNKDAACYLAGGSTSWCFAQWHRQFWESYERGGNDLYEIVLNGERYAAAVHRNSIVEVKNAENDDVNADVILAVTDALEAAGLVDVQSDDVSGADDDDDPWADLENAEEWQTAGFGVEVAREWQNHGITSAEEAGGWLDVGVIPQVAAEFSDAGLTPAGVGNVIRHSTARLTVPQVRDVVSASGGAVDDAGLLTLLPYSMGMPSRARAEWLGLAASNVDPRNLPQLQAFGIEALTPEERAAFAPLVQAWIAENNALTLEQVYDLMVRYGPKLADAFIKGYHKPEEAEAWAQSDVPHEWAATMNSPEEARAWMAAGYAHNSGEVGHYGGFTDPAGMAAWALVPSTRQGKSLWHTLGFTAEEAKLWAENRWTPFDAKHHRARGGQPTDAPRRDAPKQAAPVGGGPLDMDENDFEDETRVDRAIPRPPELEEVLYG